MAFCNSCGATLKEGTAFCGKCGAPVSGATPPRMSPVATGPLPSPAPPRQNNTAAKTILMVVGLIVVLGIVALATLAFIGVRIARHMHVTQEGDHVKVETPFGGVETSKDPEKTAKDLEMDIYPRAEVERQGAATVTFGGIRTVTASFDSDDAADKVCSFYREKFPNAKVSTSEHNHCTIVSDTGGNVVTINIDNRGDGSRFQITKVYKHVGSSSQ